MPVPSELLAALAPLLDQVLDLDPAERAAWLTALRARDPPRASDLEQLLATESTLDAEGFLVEPAESAPSLAGLRLGGYTLERPLGQGGMGTVWLARRSDGRYEGTAAVKLLNLALLDEAGLERFRREGSLLARLNHPHIARLLDAGVTPGGQPYLVLEHVEGERVDHYADARRLPVEARVRLVLDVLAAVAHAHANLVVHRDIKPSNILVGRDGQVKLLDFGIAKLVEAGEADPVTATESGGRALTPEWAAPEQATGAAITTATDVYALGVLLFLLLTGRHPTGEGARTPAEHLRAVLDTEPPRLSSVVTGAEARDSTPERLRRSLAGDLDNIAAKALKKRPEERYPTVSAFRDDLQRYLVHEPVSARPDSLGYRVRKLIRRNRLPFTLAVLGLLALAAGLVGTVTQAARATAQAARADSAAAASAAQRDFALGQLSRAEAINELNTFLLTDAAPSGGSFTVGDLLARAESLVDREHAGTPANRVEILVSLGQQYLDVDEDARARAPLERAYLLSREVQDRATRARAACALGRNLARLGSPDSAQALAGEGLALLPDEPLYATARVFCLLAASDIARSGGRGEDAVVHAEAALRLVESMPSPPPGLRLRALMLTAASYNATGRRREADTLFSDAREELGKLGRENTQTAVTLYNDWGVTLARIGQPRRAEELYREAIRISSTSSQGDEALDPIVLHNLAQTLGDLGRQEDAVAAAERANRIARRKGQDVALNATLRTLFTLYLGLGRTERAEAALAEVEPRIRRASPPGHFVFAGLVSDRSMLLSRRGDLAGALRLADSAITMSDKLQNRRNVQPVFLRRRAEIELRLGKVGDASRDAAASLEMTRAQAQAGQPSSSVGLSHLLLGRTLRAEGQGDASAAAFDSAVAHLLPTLGPDHPKAKEALDSAGPTRSP